MSDQFQPATSAPLPEPSDTTGEPRTKTRTPIKMHHAAFFPAVVEGSGQLMQKRLGQHTQQCTRQSTHSARPAPSQAPPPSLASSSGDAATTAATSEYAQLPLRNANPGVSRVTPQQASLTDMSRGSGDQDEVYAHLSCNTTNADLEGKNVSIRTLVQHKQLNIQPCLQLDASTRLGFSSCFERSAVPSRQPAQQPAGAAAAAGGTTSASDQGQLTSEYSHSFDSTLSTERSFQGRQQTFSDGHVDLRTCSASSGCTQSHMQVLTLQSAAPSYPVDDAVRVRGPAQQAQDENPRAHSPVRILD